MTGVSMYTIKSSVIYVPTHPAIYFKCSSQISPKGKKSLKLIKYKVKLRTCSQYGLPATYSMYSENKYTNGEDGYDYRTFYFLHVTRTYKQI